MLLRCPVPVPFRVGIMTQPMRLTRAAGRRDLRDFLALTERIYGRDPRHVPVPRQQIHRWFRGEVPGVRLCVMRNGCGDTVARTTLHADAVFDAKLGRPMQLFGLTEFADRAGVAEALFDAICAAGQASGKAAAEHAAGDDQAAPSMMRDAAVACWTGSLLSPRRTLCIDSAKVWPARRQRCRFTIMGTTAGSFT